MHIIFDTVNIYYIPQFLPIYLELLKRGHNAEFILYENKNKSSAFELELNRLKVKYSWVSDDQAAAKLYQNLKPNWIFFGNSFDYLKDLDSATKTAQLGHGVGPKPSYYHKSSTPMSVRFVEGSQRLKKIRQLYPLDTFVQVGFSKLDPLFNHLEEGLDFIALGLDPSKKTILYAPTFNPSSLECFGDDWPEDFTAFNILIKPHTFTYTRPQFKNQRKKLEKWTRFPNVHVANESEFSLLPYMKDADILLSEASSTLFEFAALDKPVIVCDFFKLKWSYRGPFKYRFEKRFGKDNVLYKDIGKHISSYQELAEAVEQQLSNVDEYAARRQRYTQDHVGSTDGKASVRIVDYLETH